MTKPTLQEAADVCAKAAYEAVMNPVWPKGRDPRDIPDMAHLIHGFFEDTPPRLRLSFGARCARQRWYDHNEPENAVKRDGMRMRHAMGQLFEDIMRIAMIEKMPAPWTLDNSWEQKLVRAWGVEGHTDTMLCYEGVPFAVADWKHTMSYVWKHWEDGRKPDPKWGYRHQADGYIQGARNLGIELEGAVWVVGLMDKPNEMYGGWMTTEELAPWGYEAETMFIQARDPNIIPPPCHPNRDASPCCAWQSKRDGRRTKYCSHLEWCEQDSRENTNK